MLPKHVVMSPDGPDSHRLKGGLGSSHEPDSHRLQSLGSSYLSRMSEAAIFIRKSRDTRQDFCKSFSQWRPIRTRALARYVKALL